MGKVSVPTGASLPRLKALDQQPGLDRQLDEAQNLCNHGARAEMIVKWLLEKLKKNVEARLEPRAWQLLTTASRLIVPERLAVQLGSSDILRIIQITLTVSTDFPSDELISSIALFCICLQQISRGHHGAPIRSILILDADRAAAFLGLWLRIVDNLIAPSNIESARYRNFVSEHDLLDFSVGIWDWRKTSSTESLCFSKECLVSATSILSSLSSCVVSTSKRTRNDQKSNALIRYKSALEAMLSRHVFVPARTAFWKSTRAADRTAGATSGPSSALEESLKQLRDDTSTVDRVPTLLNIALSSVPVMTLKQRLHEQPWIEAIMDQLEKLLVKTNDEHRFSTIADMLYILEEHRFAPSKGTLVDLAERQSESVDAATILARSRMIAQIIQLDASVYLDEEKAQSLFTWLSEQLVRPEMLKHSGNISGYCAEKLIVPIAQAFATQHELPKFIKLWHTQITKTQSEVNDLHFWTQFQASFSQIAVQSLTESQIQTILELHSRSFENVLGASRKTSLSAAEIRTILASIVILDGIVGGVYTDDLIKALMSALGAQLQTILSLFDNKLLRKAEIFKAPCIWTLMTKLFHTWFPKWAIEQDTQDAVIQHLLSLFCRKTAFSKAVTAAQNICATATQGWSLDDFATVQACEAADFLMSIADAFLQFSDPSLNERADELLQVSKYPIAALLNHPRSSGHLRTKIVTEVWNSTMHTPDELHDRDTTIFKALVDAGLDPSADDACFDAVISKISSEEEQIQLQALSILSSLSIDRCSQNQRKMIADSLVKVLTSRTRKPDSILYGKALSIFVQAIRSAHTVAAMNSHPDLLWRLVDPEHNLTRLAKGKHRPQTQDLPGGLKALLQEAIRLILSQLLTTADQESARDVLDRINDSLKHYCVLLSQPSTPAAYPLILLAVQTILQEVVGTRKSAMHIENGHITPYVKALINGIETWLATAASTNDEVTIAPPLCVFQAVLAANPELLRIGNVENSTISAYISQFAQRFANEAISENAQATVAVCFQIACRWSISIGDPHFLQLGKQSLATASLSPAIHEEILRDFRSALKRHVDSTTKVRAMKTLTSSGESERSSSLRLLQCIISACEEKDFANESSLNASSIFSAILDVARGAKNTADSRRAVECIMTVLREKPFMTNQFTVEQTVSTLEHLLRQEYAKSATYLDVCHILTALLQQYRSRIQDRMHLMVPLLQTLISSLFQQPVRQGNGEGSTRKPTPGHARALSRVLQLLCNPPRMRVVSSASELVDHTRKAQGHVGRHLQYVLHHYCTEILNSRLEEDVREALLPGLWALIEAMEIGDADAVRVLSAAMNQSERAVLRGLYEQYKRVREL